jgi:hypothetical protein
MKLVLILIMNKIWYSIKKIYKKGMKMNDE